MTAVGGYFSHGGAGLAKQLLREMLANGFTLIEDMSARSGEWTTPTVVHTHPLPISVNVNGLPVNTDIHLPVCMLATGFTARDNFGSTLTLGVDYTINRALGTFRILTGGALEAGFNPGYGRNTNFTIDAGFQLLRGWFILASTGVSTTESIVVGMIFDRLSGAGNISNPIKTGPRWTVFSQWATGSTNFNTAGLTFRNAPADDVLQFVHPDFSGVYEGSITADRIIASGTNTAAVSWVFAGALARFRPAVEQPCVAALAGNTAAATPDDDGIVGDTAQPGVMGANQGAVWLYDLGRFSSVADPVAINANTWSRTVGSVSNGYTPSQVVLNNPGPGAAAQYYFELHDVIAGRNVDQLNSESNILYGIFEGLKAVLCFDAQHDLSLSWDGHTYQLWRVGSNSGRHVAVEVM